MTPWSATPAGAVPTMLGDTINGGPGNDFIDGWTGNDLLQGGPDNDTIIEGRPGTIPPPTSTRQAR